MTDGRTDTHLDFPVAGAGGDESVVGGEGAAEHLVIMGLDLCQLLT